jgi:hypothetical protein
LVVQERLLSSAEGPFNEVVGKLKKGPIRDKMRIVIHLPGARFGHSRGVESAAEQALKYSG